jgi:hypothetical protein
MIRTLLVLSLLAALPACWSTDGHRLGVHYGRYDADGGGAWDGAGPSAGSWDGGDGDAWGLSYTLPIGDSEDADRLREIRAAARGAETGIDELGTGLDGLDATLRGLRMDLASYEAARAAERTEKEAATEESGEALEGADGQPEAPDPLGIGGLLSLVDRASGRAADYVVVIAAIALAVVFVRRYWMNRK